MDFSLALHTGNYWHEIALFLLCHSVNYDQIYAFRKLWDEIAVFLLCQSVYCDERYAFRKLWNRITVFYCASLYNVMRNILAVNYEIKLQCFIVPVCIMWWEICIQEAMKYNCSVFIVPACIMCVAMVVADYDAPVAENGDLTEKYFIIKKVLHEMLPSAEGLFMSLFEFCYQLALVKIIFCLVLYITFHFHS